MATVLPYVAQRFAATAEHYVRGRPPYSERLISRVAERVGLSPGDRVLDLGCGPAQLAIAFAPMVREVIAADPSEDMLAVARARVPANVRVMRASSYDLGPSFGALRLAVMGRAFHWMDRVDTLRRLDALVEPGGAVALFDDTHPDVPDNAWMAEYCAILAAHTPKDAEKAALLPGWVRHEGILLDSPFPVVEQFTCYDRRRIAADVLLHRTLSMSFTAPDRLPDGGEALSRDIAALTARIAPDGWLTEVVASHALVATRA